MSCDEELATGTCGAVTMERLRYFTGRHMTARDFQDEQSYHRSHRELHNRMLHGWGIVCGLQVRPHPKPDCRTQRVVVRCGMAIDCCGRELVVRRDVVTDVIPWGDQPRVEGETRGDPDYVLLLCLEYCEAPTEKVPVLYNEAACASPPMEYGRVREGVRFAWHWVTRDKLGDNGWRTHDGCAPGDEHPTSPCDDTHGHRDCCLDVECPEHHCVPLAVLTESLAEHGGAPHIDQSGRRPLDDDARAQLTHLCWINWPHGGVVSTSMLETLGRLEARFDRDLEVVTQPGPKEWCGPRGVNQCTFIVQFGGGYEDLDFVKPVKPPYLAADRRTAVFELLDRDDDQYRYLMNQTVFVTIKCEFLLDCNGQAVDGNHIGGRRPTGNGTPGGTFESWFTVVPDWKYDELHKKELELQQTDYVKTEA